MSTTLKQKTASLPAKQRKEVEARTDALIAEGFQRGEDLFRKNEFLEDMRAIRKYKLGEIDLPTYDYRGMRIPSYKHFFAFVRQECTPMAYNLVVIEAASVREARVKAKALGIKCGAKVDPWMPLMPDRAKYPRTIDTCTKDFGRWKSETFYTPEGYYLDGLRFFKRDLKCGLLIIFFLSGRISELGLSTESFVDRSGQVWTGVDGGFTNG